MVVESHQCDDDRERRLERALAAYLEAAKRGEPPDADRFLAAHPDLADELRQFLDLQAKIIEMAAPHPAPVVEVVGAPSVEIGPIVGDYEILSLIARGGMGTVYRARQRSLGRPVALKMLNDEGGAADDLRFRREAETIARLDHPHIVPVYEVGEHVGRRYFSMKLVEGGNLAERINAYADDHRAPARVVAAVARAMHYAHGRGVLHRDLKPSNVLLDDRGEPMVIDFGLALRIDSEGAGTRTGLAPGTPAYMAPEQLDGRREAITPATDVYGLGTILYVLLTGRLPFRGETPWAILDQVRERAPDPPCSIRPTIGRDLETICLKCLEKDPALRYATAEAMADDLERWLSGRPIAARRIGPVGRARMFARRHPASAALAIALVMLAGAAGVGAYRWTEATREKARLDQQARRQAQALAAEKSAGDFAQAWRDWGENKRDSVRLILERHGPAAGAPDDRGFAWRYLDRLAHVGRPLSRDHQNAVYSAAFSPDGTSLVTVGQDRIIRFWDPINGGLRSAGGHTNEVNSVAFSPDGRLIATASDDQTVRIWDVRTGRESATLSGLGDEVVAAVFSPDGRRLFSGCRKGQVIAWDTATWRGSRPFIAPNAPRLQGLAISPDGSSLAIAGRGVIILDLPTGRERARLKPFIDRELNCVAFSPDGRTLAGAGPEDCVSLWDTHDWTLAGVWPMSDGQIEGVAFAADGRRLAAVGGRGLVHLIDPATGERNLIATGQDRIWCAAFSPDGHTLATGSRDSTVILWDPGRDGTHIARSIPTETLAAFEFSPDGKELTAVDQQGRVWIHDARRGQIRKDFRLDAGAPIVQVALSADSRWLAALTVSHGLGVWGLPDGRLSPRPIPDRLGRWVAISPDGRWLATQADPQDLLIWSREQGRMGGHLREGGIDRVVFSPSGDLVSAVIGKVGKLVLCDLATWRPRIAKSGLPIDAMTCQAFSRDGALLATGGDGGLIVVWDARTLEPALRLSGMTTRVDALAFTPDGRTLAAGEADGRVSLWDLATGWRLMSLEGHTGPVRQVRFSPDGLTLATTAAAPDGTTELFLWPAAPPD